MFTVFTVLLVAALLMFALLIRFRRPRAQSAHRKRIALAQVFASTQTNPTFAVTMRGRTSESNQHLRAVVYLHRALALIFMNGLLDATFG
jgi:uncharacterized membrane protein